MDIDLRISVSDYDVEGYVDVRVQEGYTTRIQGIFDADDDGAIMDFIRESVPVVFRLAELRDKQEEREREQRERMEASETVDSPTG